MPIIAPSFLASDLLRLGEEGNMINKSEAEWFHLDIMDGRFVPNISFGIPIVESVRKTTKKILDVHLMIVEPEKYAEAFKNAGADFLSVHFEACKHLHRNIEQIKNLGIKAGVVINPATPVDFLKDILFDVDLVLIMSVNPGFGGQKFIPHSIEKIKQLRQLIDEKNYHALIEVDGGITLENASLIVEAGADVLVVGSSIFKSPDPVATIALLKNIL
ncbi:MAG: ribulose-phosphate 3-epimerase [Chitinophagaceae bacterium]